MIQFLPTSTPPAPPAAPVGFFTQQNADGISIDVCVKIFGGSTVIIGTIQDGGVNSGSFVRAVVPSNDAGAMGITLDANGKIVVV